MFGSADAGTSPLLVVLLLTILPTLCCAQADALEEKVCIGTNGRMSVPSNREHHYRNLRERYINCSYVDGNLELTWIGDENLDLSFLQHIREVTGYVLISHVHVRRVVLPRLQIIRGRSLFRLSIHQQEFALLISLCKMHTIEMPALRDVLSGGVGLFNNYNLCHIRSINWKEIITGPSFYDVYVYNFTSPERDCPSCDPSCTGGCWGEGPENCQKFSKINCSPQCSKGRCFGPNPRECCHLFCAGGCTGPKQNDCLACRNFYDDGECTQDCPPMQAYNPSTYSWEVNPRGKYAYGATCVKNCPEHLLKDNGACVRSCPPGKKAVKGECVPCDGPCPKACEGVDAEGSVHSGNIDRFADCTVIDGSITILDHSFVGFQQVYNNFSFGARHAPMHPDRLEVFRSVKEITGYINIQASHPDFKNLSYFRNLEVIGGRTLTEYFAVFIVKTSLTSLGLQSLKRISSGSIGILENKELCYAYGINWDSIKLAAGHRALIQHNKEVNLCNDEGQVCDAECTSDGCWGPGPDHCLSCNNYKFGTKCLQNCSAVAGMYTAGPKTCMSCHEQCESTCYGPGPGNCTICRHVRDGPFCSPFCPSSKFDDSGECQLCHPNCVDGCTGPENNIGPRGCKSCEKAIINGDVNVESCLHKNESCPDGYYSEYVGPQDQGPLRQLAGKAICRKCHPRCKRCTGYGFHVQVCQECANYKRGEQCEDECPQDHYAEETTRECLQCDIECKGCYGPDPSHCYTCRNFKLYQDGDGPSQPGANETMFNCTAHCPAEAPHKIFPEDNNREPYCSSSPMSALGPSSKQLSGGSHLGYSLGGLAVALLLACAIAIFCYVEYLKRDKKEQAAMARVLSGIDDNEPLRPSNLKPNLKTLKMITDKDLKRGKILGMGAFGTVYQGVLEDPKCKVPVAIKVLRRDPAAGGASGTKEFLEEALIMATVDHPNLLHLLGVCMTNEIQLVTQLMPAGCLLDFVRNNKDTIRSKSLLNWCTQIARGMAYLEELRLVHRDLAARNVLLHGHSVIKITDFGLAKLLDVDEDVYKAGGGKMPIKWLALECIQHRVFTHKSDVWAFGVTVWEVMTFGGRPYENVPARDVPELLEKGERLPQPTICTVDVYVTMVKCWVLDADSRPTFRELAGEFSKMARDPERYIVLPGEKWSRELAIDAQLQAHGAVVLPEFQVPDSRYRPQQSNSNSPPPSPAGPLPPGRYSSDPLHIKEFEELSYAEPAKVGDLKLSIPVDEDDYLMPSMQASSTSPYMDIISDSSGKPTFLDPKVIQRIAKGTTCVDNPEYLLNSSQCEGAIGIPIVVTHHARHKSSEDESDHEYYNDIDRLQRERQPLRRNETTV